MQQNGLWTVLSVVSIILLLGSACVAILYFKKNAELPAEPQQQAVVSPRNA